ncbi:TPA: hypothetical protein ACXG9J_002595 [Klebsiella pneumoniae]|jgi:hypothetical protein|nr:MULTISPECIES: hypothetical protein [Klebsiella]DAV14733.1 MAG TPA: hypothetical protein [Caudoviricetes sp.]AEJ97399.1 hypothetical protein KPN2242_07405 [Klebsiella pneumoniae KCTC 2242]AWG75670.1 hypothetical protein DBZ61_19415 [Klebsiella pneumoniae]AXF30490.1 hypothetical protein DTN91_23925 [Klebsiella pneumoniae subsp. pneumoniae]AXS35480.1 hypothetical protein D0897_10950 [Klebsiella pneumoniae]
MSFTVTKEVKELVSYPELGASCPLTTASKEITYTANRLVSLSGAVAQVLFAVQVGDSETPGERYHLFNYSGTGNPLEEAELSLRMSLENNE